MSPALFQMLLDASLTLCALGLLWRMSAWFRVCIGPDARTVTVSQRIGATICGIAGALTSRRRFRFLTALCLDVGLQRRLYGNDRARWLAHFFVVIGFMLLLLMHALSTLVTIKLFPGYESTRMPYLFLRNLFGALALVGLAAFLVGRWRRRNTSVLVRRPAPMAFVSLLGLILVTGFLLEAQKIASPQAFYRMAKEFNGSADPVALEPLRAVWASDFGVAFDDLKAPAGAELMAKGFEMHEDDCATCHAKSSMAFVSYPVAKMLAPVAGLLDASRADAWLLYVHLFACFLGLATLPFTRFFHAVAAPVSLLVNGTAPSREFSTAGRVARRAMALDACVGCGICDERCSVAPLAAYLGNQYLLPSFKLVATGTLVDGRLNRSDHDDQGLRVATGAFLCTDCGRCSSQCPVGLDLDDLWQAGRDDLVAAGFPTPAQWGRVRYAPTWDGSPESNAWQPRLAVPAAAYALLSDDRRSFSRCVQCQTCTNVCPVVAHSRDPAFGVDLTPQKVMNLLRLGLRELALGSRMVGDCASCYECQEHCPEGIRVTDIMVELRAMAAHRFDPARDPRGSP